MKIKIFFLIMAMISWICSTGYQTAIAQYKIKQSVFGNGCTTIKSDNQQIKGTIGQPVIGLTQNNDINNRIGFWYQTPGLDTRLSPLNVNLPLEYELAQNYPNPFNPGTTIHYQLPQNSHVKISIVNLLGQEIRTLIYEYRPAGDYSTHWDGKDDSGNPVASGIYAYRMKAGNFVSTKKMAMLK